MARLANVAAGMFEIAVHAGDIAETEADVAIFKNAHVFLGADAYIAEIENIDDVVLPGEFKVFESKRIRPKYFAFFGVGNVYDFRYSEIREFSRVALANLTASGLIASTVAMVTHGHGYGLDEKEAFTSLVQGLFDAFSEKSYPPNLQTILVVDRDAARATRYKRLLSALIRDYTKQIAEVHTTSNTEVWSSFSRPTQPTKKARVFLAMPYASEFDDEHSAIREACESGDVLCERTDHAFFSGDIVDRIMASIDQCDVFIALLNGLNPNVFLELGYAMGHRKNIVIVSRKGTEIPFDIRTMRRVDYVSVFALRGELMKLIPALLKSEE